MKIRVAGIVDESIVDGPDFRFTVFVQGCPHHCPGCHNPGTWDPNGGTEYDTDDLAERYIKNPFLEHITLSGGEPFDQAEACVAFLKEACRRTHSVWCYTGYTWDELMARNDPHTKELLKYIEVLVDGRFDQKQRTLELPWRGSLNQRLIDVGASLATGHVVKYLLEGYEHDNDDLAEYLKEKDEYENPQ